MNRRKISAGLVAGALALFGLGAGTAQAQAPKPAAPAVPSTFILPLPVPLSVIVTTGPGGALQDVSLDPSDAAVTVTKDRPRKVSFTIDETGVKVSVKSKGQTQSASVRGGSLAEVSGAGGWSGDLWGDGSTTTVGFTVGGTDDAPTLTIDNPGGGTPEGPTPFSDDDGEEVGVKASITFTSPDGTMSRTLSIKVKVENESDDDDDDGHESHASVKITLGKLRGLPQEAGAVVGVEQTWSGLLCDNTTGTILFMVDADGNIDVTGGSPTADRVKEDGRKAEVRLPGGERIKIRASVNDAGQITINFQEKIRCRDAQNPTVNGQPVTSVDDDDDHDDDHDGDHHRGGDDNGGRRGGGGDHDSDD